MFIFEHKIFSSGIISTQQHIVINFEIYVSNKVEFIATLITWSLCLCCTATKNDNKFYFHARTNTKFDYFIYLCLLKSKLINYIEKVSQLK